MTGTKMVLNLRAESGEGIHDFIEMLENVIDDIKGGVESNDSHSEKEEPYYLLSWIINPN